MVPLARKVGVVYPEEPCIWKMVPTAQVGVMPMFYANQVIMESMEEEMLEQAAQTAQIPGLSYLGYTADAHVGHGTAIGTTMVSQLKDETPTMISGTTVGVDIGCGMSLQLTPLSADDLQDRSQIRQLMREIEKQIKPGEGNKTDWVLEEHAIRTMCNMGLACMEPWFAKIQAAHELPHIESVNLPAYQSAAAEAVAAAISQRAWQRTMSTLGTLGGGNHFCEVQIIRVNPEMAALAAQWGLFDGQVVISLHSGSRGGGHQIAMDHEKIMNTAMKQWGAFRPNKSTTYVPLESEIGQRYFYAQSFALNASRLNRVLMRAAIRKALQVTYGIAASDVSLLYDIAHNFATIEREGKENYLIHRKGATRAFPAHHHMNPPAYQETGHPVLIPGSMGANSRSYILVGQPGGKQNYYTVNHGAGRVMSRRAAREQITAEAMQASLTYTDAITSRLPFRLPVNEVLVNKRNLKDVIDEAPDAYKDAQEIINSVVGAGLAKTVAECYPIAVIKG